MTYGIIDRKSHRFYTYMSAVFQAIENRQRQYNWLIADCECYPKDKEIAQLLNQEYCWLSGDELTAIVEKEDFQWIWGVLYGYEKCVSLEEVLNYPLPSAEGYSAYYDNPVSLQHPLSTVEMIAWDSSWTVIVSKDKTITDGYLAHFPKAEELSLFNEK